MKDPDIVEREVKQMSLDRHNWKMGIDFKNSNQEEFKTHMEDKYKYLKESSKTLFKNVLEDKVEKRNFQFLLSMMREVYNKNKSPDQADSIVGEEFANKYLKPHIDKMKNGQ